MHASRIKHMVMVEMNLFLELGIERQTQSGHVDTAWEGEGGLNRKIRTEIDTPPCVKQRASRNLLYSTGAQLGASMVIDEWEVMVRRKLGTRLCVYTEPSNYCMKLT